VSPVRDLDAIALTEEIRGEAILPREVDGGEAAGDNTPDTALIRDVYRYARAHVPQHSRDSAATEFDAWLRQHDAEVAAKAVEDARAEMRRMMDGFPQHGRHTRASWALNWLDVIVARIQGGAS
jgi:hypothetical protein